MDSSASNPPSLMLHGTPITGFSVKPTTAPVTWAESPEIAMYNLTAFVSSMNFSNFLGCLIGDITLVLYVILSLSRNLVVFFAIFISE